MTDKILAEYRKLRREHPFMPATTVLAWAKTPNARELWESVRISDTDWAREVDGFTITLKAEAESIFPESNRHGDTDYGRYVDETNIDYRYDWRGNWPPPAESAPLGIPYTSIRYDGPGWVQGERGGYFIPDGIAEQYDYYRRAGQSRSVAWDLTKRWVEDQIAMLFHAPLTNYHVTVTASKEDVELASTSMGTDTSDDDYIFQMVEEYAMIAEVIEEAQATIAKLCTTTELESHGDA